MVSVIHQGKWLVLSRWLKAIKRGGGAGKWGLELGCGSSKGETEKRSQIESNSAETISSKKTHGSQIWGSGAMKRAWFWAQRGPPWCVEERLWEPSQARDGLYSLSYVFPLPELDSQEAYLGHSRWDSTDGSRGIQDKWLFPTGRKITQQWKLCRLCVVRADNQPNRMQHIYIRKIKTYMHNIIFKGGGLGYQM